MTYVKLEIFLLSIHHTNTKELMKRKSAMVNQIGAILIPTILGINAQLTRQEKGSIQFLSNTDSSQRNKILL